MLECENTYGLRGKWSKLSDIASTQHPNKKISCVGRWAVRGWSTTFALAERTEAWYERQQRVDYAETSSMLTSWKKQEDLQFLNEVSCVPLQQGLRHLQKAFSNFFAGGRAYPNFKKRHNGAECRRTEASVRRTSLAVRSSQSLHSRGRMAMCFWQSVKRRCQFVGAAHCHPGVRHLLSQSSLTLRDAGMFRCW